MIPVREDEQQALHIGVNAHLLSAAAGYRSAGISWYIHNLLEHLPQVDPQIAYTVFASNWRLGDVPGLHLRISPLPTHRPPVRIFWEQVIQPYALRRSRADLCHGPAFVGAVVSACPLVVTVHDLSFLLYPEAFRTLNRLYLKTFTRQSVRRAKRVIAVSDSTKRDLVRYYGIAPTKVDVIYNGVDGSFHPLPAEHVDAFREERHLPDRFILFVGTLEPRKNVANLIQAYAQLPPDRPPLMLIGGRGWLYDEIYERIEALNLSDEIQFVGYVPPDDLPWWYNAAELFVYPSLYEGFGLPPLEAMACGTPVITSSSSSLPEVVGQAGMLVDPNDSQMLADAMQHVLSDTDARTRMKAAGVERAKGFSWEQTARHTLGSYRLALMPVEGKQGV
jgi:glycosyltransferase involved in cell wall biosynthesis